MIDRDIARSVTTGISEMAVPPDKEEDEDGLAAIAVEEEVDGRAVGLAVGGANEQPLLLPCLGASNARTVTGGGALKPAAPIASDSRSAATTAAREGIDRGEQKLVHK